MKLTSSQVEPFPDETMEIRQARFQSSSLLYWKMNCIKQYLLLPMDTEENRKEKTLVSKMSNEGTHIFYTEKK